MPVYLDARDNLFLVVGRVLVPVAVVGLRRVGVAGIRVDILVAEDLGRGRARLASIVVAKEVIAPLVEVNGVLGIRHGARGTGGFGSWFQRQWRGTAVF